MTRFFPNPLLRNGIVLLLLYVMMGVTVPNPYVSSAMSLLSLMAGVAMFSRYAETSYEILFKGERSSGGGHLAVLGASIQSAGVIYSGLFSLIWIYYGQPPEWTGTAVSSFGRGLVAVGFWMMTVSVDDPTVPSKYPSGFWRMVFIACAIVVAFVAGTHFSNL